MNLSVLAASVSIAVIACAETPPTSLLVFEARSPTSSFIQADVAGSLSVYEGHVELILDSLRMSVYSDDIWDELAMRAVLLRVDGADLVNVDSSSTQPLRRDRFPGPRASDGWSVMQPTEAMRLRRGTPRSTRYRLGIEFIGRSPMTGRRSSSWAWLDSSVVRHLAAP